MGRHFDRLSELVADEFFAAETFENGTSVQEYLVQQLDGTFVIDALGVNWLHESSGMSREAFAETVQNYLARVLSGQVQWPRVFAVEDPNFLVIAQRFEDYFALTTCQYHDTDTHAYEGLLVQIGRIKPYGAQWPIAGNGTLEFMHLNFPKVDIETFDDKIIGRSYLASSARSLFMHAAYQEAFGQQVFSGRGLETQFDHTMH